MNVIKLILIIVAVLGLLAVSMTPATAATRTWNGSQSTDWFTASNWDENDVPDGDDDVVIGLSFTVLIADNEDAAECKTLDIDLGSMLTIKGMALKLGDSAADSTSTLAADFPAVPATIRLIEDDDEVAVRHGLVYSFQLG